MKKKRRVWAYIGIGVTLFVAALFFLATREHPDYVRAAKLLPAARKEAEAMFGPLNWDEWREENGIDPDVDVELWRTAADSIPQSITTYWDDRAASPLTSQEIFLQERAWFDRIDVLTTGLKVRHIQSETSDDWDLDYVRYSKQIVRACSSGVIGAAANGKSDEVLRIGRISIRIINELRVEPSEIMNLYANAFQANLIEALMRAAVRNREDQDVLDAVRLLIDELPATPSIREISGGDLRNAQIGFDVLRSLSPTELSELAAESVAESADSAFIEKVVEFVDGLTGSEIKKSGRTGPHTADALEARMLEVMVEATLMKEAIERNELNSRENLVELDEKMNSSSDRSTGFTFLANTDPLFINSRQRNEFFLRSISAAFEMIDRFPNYDELPDEIPAEFQFPDPFGGDPAGYIKTARGFLIYTIGSEYDDTVYEPIYPEMLDREVGLTKGLFDGQWAYVVSYDPVNPPP